VTKPPIEDNYLINDDAAGLFWEFLIMEKVGKFLELQELFKDPRGLDKFFDLLGENGFTWATIKK
jgi:hypothetical protein